WVQHVSPFVANALREARCFNDVAMLSQEGLTRAPALVQVLAQILGGAPTSFAVERALGLKSAAECGQVDRLSDRGLIFIIPVVPLAPEAVLTGLGILDDFARRYQVAINATINILSEHAVELVSSIIFDRTAKGIEQAHALKKRILEELARRDISLMRLDLDSQNDPRLFTERSYRDALLKLKHTFDPNNILAPGRYIPRA